MIRYALACSDAHSFESWFASSTSFDEQKSRGLVECPVCGSTAVDKAIMAPAIATSRAVAPRETKAEPAPAAPQPVALLDDKQKAIRAMIRELHQKINENSTDVGSRFVDEARAIHEGRAPERSIYGQATAEDARGLLEDGIAVMPIPTLPDERN